MRSFLVVSAALCTALLVSCSSSPSCTPGQQIACPCAGGAQGVQVCNASGTGFDPCGQCVASNPDSGAPDAGADAGADAGIDAGTDAGIADAGTDGGTCVPGDVSGFTAPAYKAPSASRGSCTLALIQTFYSLCLAENAPAGQCSAQFGNNGSQANKTCAACLLTASTDPTWGPLVDSAGTVEINVNGCLHLTGGDAGATCARANQALKECSVAACQTNCPVTDGPSLASYVACQRQSYDLGCSGFADAGNCVDRFVDAGSPDAGPLPDGGVSYDPARCVLSPSATFQERYEAIAPVFCGP